MKKLITLLLVLVTLNGYSQNYDWLLEKYGTKPLKVEPYIIKKVNDKNPSPSQINTDSLEFLIANRIKELRDQNNLEPFVYSEKASKIASIQTNYVMKYNHKSHTQIYGNNILKKAMDRAHSIDPKILYVSEALVGRDNIYLNTETDLNKLAIGIVKQWVDSESHRLLILCECKTWEGIHTNFGLSFRYDPTKLMLVGTLFKY